MKGFGKQVRNAAVLAAFGVGHTWAMAQVVVTYGPVDVASVPTLSEWGMVITAVLLAGVAAFAMRKKANSKTILSLALSAIGLFGGAFGHDVIDEAWSILLPEMTAPTGGVVNLPSNVGVLPVENATQVPLKIMGVTPADVQNSPTTTCDPGVIVAPQATCNVDTNGGVT